MKNPLLIVGAMLLTGCGGGTDYTTPAPSVTDNSTGNPFALSVTSAPENPPAPQTVEPIAESGPQPAAGVPAAVTEPVAEVPREVTPPIRVINHTCVKTLDNIQAFFTSLDHAHVACAVDCPAGLKMISGYARGDRTLGIYENLTNESLLTTYNFAQSGIGKSTAEMLLADKIAYTYFDPDSLDENGPREFTVNMTVTCGVIQ